VEGGGGQKKAPPFRISSEEGVVCAERRMLVGNKTPPSHIRAPVHIERWWWCQTDGSGGQKSPSVLHLNEEGVVVGKRAPPSCIRAMIPPPSIVLVRLCWPCWQWWWCGWKGTHTVTTEKETLSVMLLQLIFRAKEGSVVAEILLRLAFRVRDGHEGSPVDVIPSRHSK